MVILKLKWSLETKDKIKSAKTNNNSKEDNKNNKSSNIDTELKVRVTN